jgi:hypothetical protein
VRLCQGRFTAILLRRGLWTKDDELLVVEGIVEHHIGASNSLAGVVLNPSLPRKDFG